jgi:hypothetical protein
MKLRLDDDAKSGIVSGIGFPGRFGGLVVVADATGYLLAASESKGN